MNWGTKIFIVLAIFVIGMAGVGVYMVSQDSDTLVNADYYQDGINFDQVYDRRQNLETYGARPAVSIENDLLTVTFVHESNRGTLSLFRASDQSLDITMPLTTQNAVFQIPVQDVESGSWELQLEWEAEGKSFQYEQQIYLN